MTYRVVLTPPVRRALSNELPESVAVAAWQFMRGPLAENPHRVGTQLRAPLDGEWVARRGTYRIVYQIHDSIVTVYVLSVAHRRDVYRRS